MFENQSLPMRAASELASVWVETIRQLSTCGRELRRHLAEAATKHGVTDTEFLLLTCCCPPHQNLSQNALAAHVGLSAGQVSGLVEALSKRQLIEVRRSELDRRRQSWHLTSTGREIVDQVSGDLAAHARRWEVALSHAEQQQLVPLLKKLLEAVRDSATHESDDQAPNVQSLEAHRLSRNETKEAA